MAAADVGVSSSFLHQSLAKHRALVLTVAGFAIGGTAFYYLTLAQQTRQVRPLHRRNAVHRRARQSTNLPLQSGITSSEEHQNHVIDEAIEELPDAPAETEVGMPAHPSAASSLQEMVYYIAEESSHQRAYVHRGVTCDECGTAIRGIRYKCTNCTNFDLCSNCEAHTLHPKTHVFLKIKIPIPGLLWRTPMDSLYPGTLDDKPSPTLPKTVTRSLLETTKFEIDEIQAFFDIFLSYTNRLWESDPTGIGRAIDSTAFEAAWRPQTRNGKSPPNTLCDRIFAFYDSDQNGLVGFLEFIRGIAVRKRKSRPPVNDTVILFNVFDADRNGWISRKDILRVFNGYYQLQKTIVLEDLDLDLEALEPASEQSVKTIYSTRPLNSMLNSLSLSRLQSNSSRKDPQMIAASSENSAMVSDSNDQEERRDIIVEMEATLSAPNGLNGVQSLDAASLQDADIESRRQRFYLDEEEGCPVSMSKNSNIANGKSDANSHDAALDDNASAPSTSADPTAENGSRACNASTPSNAAECAESIGESASHNHLQHSRKEHLVSNGYEVPLRDSVVAKEIVYQLMQESINKDLDWLFKTKEQLALEVERTKSGREQWHQNRIRNIAEAPEAVDPSSDPTQEDLHDSNTFTEDISRRYGHLDYVEAEIERAGGPGRLNYSEFAKIMSIDEGKRFEFLASWLDFGNF